MDDTKIDMSLDDIISLNKKTNRSKRGRGSSVLTKFKNNRTNNVNVGVSPLNRSSNSGRGGTFRNTRGGFRIGSQRGTLSQGGLPRRSFNNYKNPNYSNNFNKVTLVRNWQPYNSNNFNQSRGRGNRIIGVSRKDSKNIVIFTQRQLAKKVMLLAKKIAAKKMNNVQASQNNTKKRRGRGQAVLNNYRNRKTQQNRGGQYDSNGMLQINVPVSTQNSGVRVLIGGRPRKNSNQQQPQQQQYFNNFNNYRKQNVQDRFNLPEKIGIPNTTSLSLSDRFAAGRNNASNERNIYY